MTELTIEADEAGDLPLHCSIPTHVARRNAIAPGVDVGVSLKADAIQLMPRATFSE